MPNPPYDVGDLWAQGENGDLMRCTTARSFGSYVAADWGLAGKSVDTLKYLTDAIHDGSTEIQGGLALSNLMFVKDLQDNIQGGMSGLADDNVGLWTGGSYEQAQNGEASVILYKDGNARLAKGNFNANSNGTGNIGSIGYDKDGMSMTSGNSTAVIKNGSR